MFLKIKSCTCCPNFPRRLNDENLLILSLIQLLCGSASIILFGVALTKEGYLYQVGAGMWSGSLMLASGCLGIATSRHRTACTLISLLIICVFSAVTSAILASLSTAGLVQDGVKSLKNSKLHLIILHTLLFIFGFLECSVAVTTAIICGHDVCFGNIYFPQNSFTQRRSYAGHNRDSHSTRNDGSLLRVQQELHVLPNLFYGTTSPPINEPLSNIICNNGQLPVLTTNSLYTNILFSNIDPQSQDFSTTCRTSLIYLLPSPSLDEPSTFFPSFPPCYIVQENRTLPSYTCLNTSGAEDSQLQVTLLIDEHPPPYSSIENLRCSNSLWLDEGTTASPDTISKLSDDDIVVLIEPNKSILTSRSSHSSSSSSSS